MAVEHSHRRSWWCQRWGRWRELTSDRGPPTDATRSVDGEGCEVSAHDRRGCAASLRGCTCTCGANACSYGSRPAALPTQLPVFPVGSVASGKTLGRTGKGRATQRRPRPLASGPPAPALQPPCPQARCPSRPLGSCAQPRPGAASAARGRAPVCGRGATRHCLPGAATTRRGSARRGCPCPARLGPPGGARSGGSVPPRAVT